MVDSGKTPEEHFIKQRRNLILISLFVIFYEVGNLTIEEINFLGNKSKLGNPEIVTFFLIVAFTYFSLRYYTACREIKGISKFLYGCSARAENKCKAFVTKKYFEPQKEKFKAVDQITRTKFTRTYMLRSERRGENGEPLHVKIVVKCRFIYNYTLSLLPTIIHTSKFTEYVLPYIIAIIAGLELLDYSLISQLIKP